MQDDKYTEVPVFETAKRLGLRWMPWMGDWFVSWSPRNDNSNAEGSWVEWVGLAVQILQDPLTKETNPEAYAAVQELRQVAHQGGGDLSEARLGDRFRRQRRREKRK